VVELLKIDRVGVDRPATREEQSELARYVGWGGLKGAFPNAQGKFGSSMLEIAQDDAARRAADEIAGPAPK
jgi:hypothetical protein